MNRRIWLLLSSCAFSIFLTTILILLWGPQTQAATFATIIVTTLDDSQPTPGHCSLREAIAAANTNLATDACAAGNEFLTDTILFDVGGTISLTEQLTVTGGGPIVIDGGNTITLSGENNWRILTVNNGASANIQNITVANGYAGTSPGGG